MVFFRCAGLVLALSLINNTNSTDATPERASWSKGVETKKSRISYLRKITVFDFSF